MKLQLTYALIFVTSFSFAQSKVLLKIPESGKTLQTFIPKGYDTIETAKGDLNKDGTEDIVMALYNPSEDTFEMDEEPVRLLLVLLKQKEGYRVGGKSETILMCRHCGGMWGDPFAQIRIKKGVLEVIHYGGSAWRWSESRKFRFQNNAFYIIGYTSDYYWNVHPCNESEFGDSGRKYRDVNWVTGDEEVIERNEDCELLKHTNKKLKKKPLVKLENFKYDF